MTSDLDIWRSARLLIKQHGADAELIACRRVDDMIELGAPEGEAAWKNILSAIRELQRSDRRDDEGVH